MQGESKEYWKRVGGKLEDYDVRMLRPTESMKKRIRKVLQEFWKSFRKVLEE